jgi:hypothetical protein
MYRLQIEDEVALRELLVDKEDNQSIQWEELSNR